MGEVSFLEGIGVEQVDLVVGVYFISCNDFFIVFYVMYSPLVDDFGLVALHQIHEDGCVHHNNVEVGGFNLLFCRKCNKNPGCS